MHPAVPNDLKRIRVAARWPSSQPRGTLRLPEDLHDVCSVRIPSPVHTKHPLRNFGGCREFPHNWNHLGGGKHTKNYGKLPWFAMVNQRTMAIFNSFLYVYQRVMIVKIMARLSSSPCLWIPSSNSSYPHKMGPPRYVCWFINQYNPSNYSYIYHKATYKAT